MDLDSALIYIVTLILYIGILFFFFWRRNKKQEQQFNAFIEEAKKKLELHKQQAHLQASGKVTKAFELIKRLQKVTEDLENQAQVEYEQILEQAKQEKQDILDEAKQKADEVLVKADHDLEVYKEERKREIEKNLVKLVVSVTEKVVSKSLDYKDHLSLIKEAVEEVKQEKGHL